MPTISPENVTVFLLFWKLYKLKSKLFHLRAPNENTAPGQSKIFLACGVIIITWVFGIKCSFLLNWNLKVFCSLTLFSNNWFFFPYINKPQKRENHKQVLQEKKKKKEKIGILELFYDPLFPPVSSYILKIEMGLAAAI